MGASAINFQAGSWRSDCLQIESELTSAGLTKAAHSYSCCCLCLQLRRSFGCACLGCSVVDGGHAVVGERCSAAVESPRRAAACPDRLLCFHSCDGGPLVMAGNPRCKFIANYGILRAGSGITAK